MKIKIYEEDLETRDNRNYAFSIDKKLFEKLFDIDASNLTLIDETYYVGNYISFDDDLLDYNLEGVFTESLYVHLHFTK
jgi:hypothetical protein